jgi:asparagine synthase (glutamine-hydrolysing)
MSVQFGRCNFDGESVDPADLDRVRSALAPHGPDGEGRLCKDNLGILYRAFHTTKESRRETQPYVSTSGFILTWDGRLDNREELIRLLVHEVASGSSDLEIVAKAYDRWRTDSFAKLLGDWALSIWNPKEQSLLLAKDFLGTRQLCYSIEQDQVTWCTILEPLVLLAGHSFNLEEEYVAGWLTFFPAPHLTPYAGIHAVPPSSFVRLTKCNQTIHKYWDFNPAARIVYRQDCEYEEHFRIVFADSVRRRLRSDSPILAELSGGMDSSSIVCIADDMIARGLAETPRLDTISYYDDSDPNWNEKAYFSIVEAKRGRIGCHIDASSQGSFPSESDGAASIVSPTSFGASGDINTSYANYRMSQGNRVLLSGTGGDEVTGGVPTPLPELQDLLVELRFGALVHQLKLWALEKRRPWLCLLRDAIGQLLPCWLAGNAREIVPAAGLRPSFAKRYRAALSGYEYRTKLLGALPSFQANISTLDMLRRQLGCDALVFNPPCENRFPFLDRNLLEFLYGVPRTQLVRPGQRRSLLRRALAGTVPDEILNRRRKAYVSRFMTDPIGPWIGSIERGEPFLTALLRIVDAEAFCELLKIVIRDQQAPNVILRRIFYLELWLRAVSKWHILGPASSSPTSCQIRDPLQMADPSKA